MLRHFLSPLIPLLNAFSATAPRSAASNPSCSGMERFIKVEALLQDCCISPPGVSNKQATECCSTFIPPVNLLLILLALVNHSYIFIKILRAFIKKGNCINISSGDTLRVTALTFSANPYFPSSFHVMRHENIGQAFVKRLHAIIKLHWNELPA